MRFRFETLLRIRKNQENLVQRDLAMINTHLLQQEHHLKTMNMLADSSRQDYNQRITQPQSAATLALFAPFLDGTKNSGQKQKQIISEIEERAETKRQELSESMQKRRTLEILKERQWIEHKKEQLKRETALLDEVAASRWNRTDV